MIALDDLLIARDFSASSDRALRHALDLAARTGAVLHVFYADVLHKKGAKPEQQSPAAGIDKVREELKRYDASPPDEALDAVEVKEGVERDVAAAPAILNYSSKHDIDVVTLGTHGRRGPRRVLIGSVAEEVVRRATCPVLTVRGSVETPGPAPGEIDRLLVPVDFSDPSQEAFRYARELAHLYDAQVHLLHVVEDILRPAFYVEDLEENVEKKARERLQQFVERTPGPEVDLDLHTTSGQAASAITTFADQHDIDLVVTSTHGRTGMQRLLLGSVAEKIVRHTHCPVFTVRSFGKSLLSEGDE